MNGSHKVCPSCGLLRPLDDQICPGCGHQFRTQFNQPVNQTQAFQPLPPNQQFPPFTPGLPGNLQTAKDLYKAKSDKAYKIAGSIVSVLFTILVLSAIGRMSKKEADEPQLTASQMASYCRYNMPSEELERLIGSPYRYQQIQGTFYWAIYPAVDYDLAVKHGNNVVLEWHIQPPPRD